MKKSGLFLLMLWTLCTLTPSYASRTTERQYLVQILNQLDAMQPLILRAQQAQPKNVRLHFHYTRYRDSRGQWHNGLLNDVQAIKKGVLQALNQTQSDIEPRAIAPLKGDYQ